MSAEDNSSDSDYDVEKFIRTKRVRRTINDDTADLLGNFDDVKRKQIFGGLYEEKQHLNDEDSNFSAENSFEVEDNVDEAEKDSESSEHMYNGQSNIDTENESLNNDMYEENMTSRYRNETTNSDQNNIQNEFSDRDDSENKNNITNMNLSKEQLALLLRGSSKVNRHVLYVTNLNFDSTKADLEQYFGVAGLVKSVRIPKKRRGGFAFVEMADLNGFQKGFQLHNTVLHGRTIRVQISEAGKKKSANKKNIIMQKNRKLAKMRNEQKTFTKSGKFYDKSLKKEKAKELLERKRWRKKPGIDNGFKN